MNVKYKRNPAVLGQGLQKFEKFGKISIHACSGLCSLIKKDTSILLNLFQRTLSLSIYISLSVLCFANYDINMFFVAVDCCIKIWIKIAYKRLFYPIHTSIENWAGVKRVTKTAIGNKCLNLSLLNLDLQRVLLPFMIKLNQTTVFSFSYEMDLFLLHLIYQTQFRYYYLSYLKHRYPILFQQV